MQVFTSKYTLNTCLLYKNYIQQPSNVAVLCLKASKMEKKRFAGKSLPHYDTPSWIQTILALIPPQRTLL